MLLLGLKHRQQTQSDCLAICIVLEYLGIPCDYKRLLRILGTTSDGTPFSNLNRLATALNLSVAYNRNQETLTVFTDHIRIGLPIIVAVQTWPLPYWHQLNTDHAVVVVGLDSEDIFIYDPYFATAPQVVELDSFLTAWSERDYEYAVIGLTAWQPGEMV